MFPISNRTGDNAKKRMRCGSDDFKVTTIERWTAAAQLTQKPPPLVLQLFVGDENALFGPDATKFGSIKNIAS